MLILNHPRTDSLVFISYSSKLGVVDVKITDPTNEAQAHVDTISLATFLREIGIPFKAVRALTAGDQAVVA